MKLFDKLKAPVVMPDDKSRLTYATLAFLFGGIGVHNFYVGNSEKAKAQLASGLIGLCCCCLPLYILSIISAWLDVVTVTAGAIMKTGVTGATDSQPKAKPEKIPAATAAEEPKEKKPFPVKMVVIIAVILFIVLPLVGSIVLFVSAHAGISAVEELEAASYAKLAAEVGKHTTKFAQPASHPSAPSTQTGRLDAAEQTKRLLDQLRRETKKMGAESAAATIESVLNMTSVENRPEILRQSLKELDIEPCVSADGRFVGSTTTCPTANLASSSTPSSTERLTPEQKTKRLMAQLRKELGNSMTVSVALAALQEKADLAQGDYKTKVVLIEMMGNSYRNGIVPDLPDPNGNGALAEYLKVRGIDDVGKIMCMYHMLTDQEQASVADEVRKLMK